MYSHGLKMLADLRLRTNQTALAIKTLERRVSVVESCFTRNGGVWATRYLDALNDLGCVYQDIEQFCKAIEVQRQAISCVSHILLMIQTLGLTFIQRCFRT